MSALFFLAQANATPPIPVVWAVLQTLGVMLAAFAVLALVMSHLRYQNEVRRVEGEKQQGMRSEALALWLMERIRRGPQSLVLFRGAAVEKPEGEAILRKSVRSGDEVLRWQEVGVLLVFEGDDVRNAAGAGRRLAALLPGDGAGAVSVAVSPAPPPLRGLQGIAEGLLEALGRTAVPDSGWHLPEVRAGDAPVLAGDQTPLLDEVTGVLRPEKVPTAVQKILAAHRRHETPVCLLLCEVDDLENYAPMEDALPLENGVLKAAAEGLMRHCRETDLVGRISHAGFVVVLAGELAVIEAVAVRMLEAARNTPVVLQGKAYPYTLSAGLAGYPEHGAGPQRLFTACHEALELAKVRGRGQLCVYDPSVKTPVAHGPRTGRAPEAF